MKRRKGGGGMIYAFNGVNLERLSLSTVYRLQVRRARAISFAVPTRKIFRVVGS